jgi:hypothetical protein
VEHLREFVDLLLSNFVFVTVVEALSVSRHYYETIRLELTALVVKV